jgi:twinkle protein
MDDREESRPVGKEPCPACGSRNNLARYDDGHAYCFTPGCGHFEPGEGDQPRSQRRTAMNYDFLDGEVRPLRRRGLTAETCAKFGYLVGENSKGAACQIAQYRDRATGLELCAQKLRFADKDAGMPVIGDIDKAGLFGQNLWKAGGKRVVITEGEIDCMSVAQAFGLSWPVVSLKRGAASAAKDIKQSLEWLESYDAIVLWFDNDEAGRKAVGEAAPLFTPGKCKIVETPA